MITQKISYLSFGKGKGLMVKLDNELAKENKRKRIDSEKPTKNRKSNK